MTTKLSLGGLVLSLFLLTGPSPLLQPVPIEQHVDIAVLRSLQQQAQLAQHLAKKYAQPLPEVTRIVKAAFHEGPRHGVPPLLILAIIEKESSFRSQVVNFYGAMGLMQVVPRYHREKLDQKKGLQQLLVPETNVRVGTQILAEYLKAHKGDLPAALKKYSGNAREYFTKVAAYRRNLMKVAHVPVAATNG